MTVGALLETHPDGTQSLHLLQAVEVAPDGTTSRAQGVDVGLTAAGPTDQLLGDCDVVSGDSATVIAHPPALGLLLSVRGLRWRRHLDRTTVTAQRGAGRSLLALAGLAAICVTAACSVGGGEDADADEDEPEHAELVSVDAEDWVAHPATDGLTAWNACGPQDTSAGLCRIDLDTGRVEVLLDTGARISNIGSFVDGRLTVTAGPTFDDMAYTVDPDERELAPLGPGLLAGVSTDDQRLMADNLVGTVQVIDYASKPPRTIATFETDPGDGSVESREVFHGVTMHDDLLWVATLKAGNPVLRALDPATGQSLRRVDLPSDPPPNGFWLIQLRDRLAVVIVREGSVESWTLPPTANLFDQPGDPIALAASALGTFPGWQIVGPVEDPTRVVAIRRDDCTGAFRCTRSKLALLSLVGDQPITLGTVPVQLLQGTVTEAP